MKIPQRRMKIPRLRMKIPWRPLLLAALLIVLPVVAACPGSRTTFDITAESEYVRYSPEISPSQHWVLDSASLFGAGDTAGTIVSGKLEFTDPVQVTIERRSLGPLLLKIEPTPARQRADAGRGAPLRVGVFNGRSGPSQPLYDDIVIEVPNVEERSRQGNPIVFAVQGSLQIGRSVQREGDPNLALLRSGKVTKFVESAKFLESAFGKSAFVAGSSDLDVGDQVTIEAPESPELGLIRADERPALTVAYRADARSVDVGRPGGGHYRIGMSIAEWVLADPMLQGWWATLGLLFGALTLFRLADWGRKRTEKSHETE
ncbi:MAG TPA: hypothetical protein VJT67_09905 [Longimicrobiaceae bacterium]|nr:hypothetical protein [Longimicrobiaceae bacterium]